MYNRLLLYSSFVLLAMFSSACSRPLVPAHTFPYDEYAIDAQRIATHVEVTIPDSNRVRLVPISGRTNERSGFVIDFAALFPPGMSIESGVVEADRAVGLASVAVHKRDSGSTAIYEALPQSLWYRHGSPPGTFRPPPVVPHAVLATTTSGTVMVFEQAFRGTLPIGDICVAVKKSDVLPSEVDFPAFCTPILIERFRAGGTTSRRN